MVKKGWLVFIISLIAAGILSMFSTASAFGEEKGQTSPASSDKRQVWMNASVLCLTEEGSRVIGDKSILPSDVLQNLIDSKKAREIETLRFQLENNLESYFFIGNKFPITWFDSKATQYQIIFVDVGIKFIIKPEIGSDEKMSFWIKSSIASTEDYKKEIERDTVFYYPSTMNTDYNQQSPRLKNGESVIISDASGFLVEHFLKESGGKDALYSKGSRLIFALTPHIVPRSGASAEEKSSEYPSAVEMKTLCISRGLSKKLHDSFRLSEEALSALIKSGEARVISTQRIFSSGKEGYMLQGRKYPLTYFDPRSGSYQVIYIDIGLKGKFKYTPAGFQRWKLEVEWETANANPSMLFGIRREQIPLQICYIRSNTSLELKKGESGIVLALRGDYYYKVIKDILFPGIVFSPDEELIFFITVR